jgi:hypothetical protein
LGSIKKIDDDDESHAVFTDSLLDAILMNAKSNLQRTTAVFTGALECNFAPMKTLSLLVLAKLMFERLFSHDQLTIILAKVKNYFQKTQFKPVSHSELKVNKGYPAAVLMAWISKGNWDLSVSYGNLHLLLMIIERYQVLEGHVFSSGQFILQQIAEIILYCGELRNWMLGQLVQSQLRTWLLEFAFSSLDASVGVLSTSLGIAQKYLEMNSQSESPKDTQVILGPLLLCLLHPEKSIRAASVGLLVTFKQCLNAYSISSGDKPTKNSIYGFGKFFGEKSSMEYLKTATAIEFVASLIERGHDMIADENYLKLNFNHVLRNLGNSKYLFLI